MKNIRKSKEKNGKSKGKHRKRISNKLKNTTLRNGVIAHYGRKFIVITRLGDPSEEEHTSFVRKFGHIFLFSFLTLDF